MELKRKCEIKIREWCRKSTKALLVKGARQVGKTHLIRRVLKEEGCDFIEINLIETPEAISILEQSRTAEDLMIGLSTINGKKLQKGQTVIFIDEVQKYKEMVTKIKFLVDEGSFRYVLSGSLLGVELTNIESAPVGYLTSIEMFPLDLEEFLQITEISDEVIHSLKKSFETRTPVMDAVNDKMLSLFRRYLVVGGMPEAVSVFAETKNLRDVINVHQDIKSLYKLDFTQYEEDDRKLMITNAYNLIPSELLKQNKRYIIGDLKKGLHYDRVESTFLWLYNAGVAIPAFNSTEPRIPLKINEKQSLFKLYMSDVGLLTSEYGMSTKRMLISNDNSLNAGGIYENAVAQQLKAAGFDIYYYNSNRLGELDFVIDYDNSSTPIEVKSGKDYNKHSALTNCLRNTEYDMKEGFVFADCNIEKDGKTTYLPIYMLMFFQKDLEDYYLE
ncbi:MAG: ATP-binding protein [Oscillospiraceae bacterium]|nr:ATP-binding protein [Oscillospiraceae bacterium]